MTATSGSGATTVETGAGNDTIAVIASASAASGANVISAGAGADNITQETNGLAAVHTIVIDDADSGIDLATVDQIVGFNAANDFIQLGATGAAANYAESSVAVDDFAQALAMADGALSELSGAERYSFQWDATNGYLFNDTDGVLAKLAAFLAGARTVTWLARGPLVAGALDAALKLQEAVGIPAFAYSTAEYLHGPIAAASPQDRVVFFAAADTAMDSQETVTTALLARAVPTLCFGSEQTPLAQLQVPFPEARWAQTALFAYIAQLTCVALAEHYGINPDEHPALRKVTETR